MNNQCPIDEKENQSRHCIEELTEKEMSIDDDIKLEGSKKEEIPEVLSLEAVSPEEVRPSTVHLRMLFFQMKRQLRNLWENMKRNR
jgi:hypothetical protein